MLRCLCCKKGQSRSSSESSVVEIHVGEEESTGAEVNAAVKGDETVDKTFRQEESEEDIPKEAEAEGLPKEQGRSLLPQQEDGGLRTVSDCPQEVGHLENVKDESIRVAMIAEAASDSSPPKFDSLAQEITISAPLKENRSLIENGQLGPDEQHTADMIKHQSESQDIYLNDSYIEEKIRKMSLTKKVIGHSSDIRINDQTEHGMKSGSSRQGPVLGEDLTNVTKNEQNFPNDDVKVRLSQDSKEEVREIDEPGHPTDNRETPEAAEPGHTTGNRETTEAAEPGHTTGNRETPDDQNSYSMSSDTTDSSCYPLGHTAENVELENENKIFQNRNQSDLRPACPQISCLYNQTGRMYTVLDERHVFTYIREAAVLVRTCVTELEGAAVGCRLVWRGRIPTPLSELPDGTEVQFDAVVLPQTKMFHTIVIWQEVKPHLVIEPPPASYIFIHGNGLTALHFVFHEEIGFAEVNYEGKTVKSELIKDVVFLNGKQASNSDMFMMSSFPSRKVFATICKLMEGDAAGTVTYTFECVWSGKRPSTDLLPNDFKRGEVYKREPSGRYIRNHEFQHLYCDVPGTLKAKGQSCALTLCIESEFISLPVTPELLYSSSNKVVSPPSSDVPVKAHIVKFGSMWKVLMIQLLSFQERKNVPYGSEVVLQAPAFAVSFHGPSQPQQGGNCGHMPVRNISDNASVRGGLGAIIRVGGCIWNLASISQGIATHLNKSILIKQDRFYVDGVKVRPSEPLAKFSKGALINAAIEPQFSPIKVFDIVVTHRAIVAWQGAKPQDVDIFLKSNSEEPFANLGFFDNNRSIKKKFVVERDHDCLTFVAGTQCHGSGMVNGVHDDTIPFQQANDKSESYVGSCNWKRASISLGIIAHSKKTIVVKPSTFFVNQVKVLGSDPLVKFTSNGMLVNAEVVALPSAHPVLGHTATHEALVAWQGKRPHEAESIIFNYYQGKTTENRFLLISRRGSRRSVFVKEGDSFSSYLTVIERSVGGSIIENVTGKLVKIGYDYGILRLQCSPIKEPNTLVVFHSLVVYIDQKKLSGEKPLNQQLSLSSPRLWNCTIQPYVAKIAEVNVQYNAILIWQGKKPKDKELLLHRTESPCAATEVGWMDTMEDRRESSINDNGNGKSSAATSSVGSTTSRPSDEGDVNRACVRGWVTELYGKRGCLRTLGGQYIDFDCNQCFLYGIRLHHVQLHHILHTGDSAECRFGKDGGGVWQTEGVWVGGGQLPRDPCDGYAVLRHWCHSHNISSMDRDTLLREAGYVAEATPAATAISNYSVVTSHENSWLPNMFPAAATAGDERCIVHPGEADWMSPDLYPTAAVGNERDIVQVDGADWMSPDLFPTAAAGDEREIVQLGWEY